MASRTPSAPVSRSVSSGSLPTRSPTPLMERSPPEKEKEAAIREACEKEQVSTLVDLATSNSGLISDSLRRTACKPRPHEHSGYSPTPKSCSPTPHTPPHRPMSSYGPLAD
ncbi:predicted protein [Plenodomus lingam JN3]|uniref:Uncharacterized protein n=1 Tax=Leptosphaeria maculans (strain JN3 / isolate v23.1.3 / race Av1-4-5-6-7-8) TaxID=985895 RepID=E5A6X1_LEPMJ|nr:predicted protein [Plenodomus lingam JN3]CBX99366.1 predicted protein [Plenodomus lingam JN3]